jgi:hypothetical protein
MQSNAAVGNLYSGARPVHIFKIRYDEYNFDFFATLQHMLKEVEHYGIQQSKSHSSIPSPQVP